MERSDTLFLHECVLLLALHDEKGTMHSAWHSLAMAGGILAELMLSGRVEVEEVGKKKMLVAADPSPLGFPLLDECLNRVVSTKRRATASTWISRFSQTKHLRDRTAERLQDLGLVRREEGRVLWIFSTVRYPTTNPAPERRLVEGLQDVLEGEGEVDARVAILLALTHTSGILRHVLGKELLKDRKDRLDAVMAMEGVGGATKAAIEAAQAAASAATAAIAAATAAASS
jgi:golgi phosphoprotein 3